MAPRLSRALRIALVCVLPIAFSFATESSYAQTRKPTAKEIASIRDCATKNKDNLEDSERRCLFNLVAEPCMGKHPQDASEAIAVDCYRMEGVIWDGLLNDNYKSLLDTLDADQTVKAQAMQRAWIAYRDTTCQFYDDKIQGSMSVRMHASCVTRETARRAMLLNFFSGL
jgi:uncharacterized protein YecT (DUF1311 family)